MIIIPAIDILNGQCVRLFQGDYNKSITYNNNPLKTAKRFVQEGALSLHIIDLDGAKTGQPVNMDTIIKIAKNINIPVQVGGGIRNYQIAANYLEQGVKKIILGTVVINNQTMIKKLISKFGTERIIVAIDTDKGKLVTNGWQVINSISIKTILKKLKQTGVTTLLVTDKQKDGTLNGPNLTLIKTILKQKFNIIAAGGVANNKDLKNLKKIGCLGAVVGKALYENKITLSNNLTKRVIPCLDINNGRVVKGIKFKNLQDAGDPVALAKKYNKDGADELVFLDISATVQKRKTQIELAKRVAKEINIPFTIGGGIKTLGDIRELLLAGADKIALNTAAVKNPKIISQAAKQFGSQCIVISLDAKRKNNSWEVYTNSGTKATGLNAIVFTKKMAKLGAGEILVNSLDRDGTKSGYDIKLLQAIGSAVNLPIIASSGAGKKEDFLTAIEKGQADAILAASLFHSGELSIKKLKKYLQNNNINIRL